ncbi:WG repeat-containing protein [Flavihumibacter profundi]|uniref:WG repeat-containing protein n=1 Tax=Flavihumibacter profundi TaxID=2716883 RepID=UPI001CC668B6|nr:WG repeat-containing protein [Flavihumibacter profundi]MBZ5857552.1 WG repeat-containing protein [Flavihumibacter profundi]
MKNINYLLLFTLVIQIITPNIARGNNKNYHKKNSFDIIKYLEERYPGVESDEKEIYRYYKTIINPDNGDTVGYNIYGAIYIVSDRGEVSSTKIIEDPFCINANGVILYENMFIYKIFGSGNICYVKPNLKFEKNVSGGAGYFDCSIDNFIINPKEFFIYNFNGKLVKHIINSTENSKDNVCDMSEYKNLDENNERIYYYYTRGCDLYNLNREGIIDSLGNIILAQKYGNITFLERQKDVDYFLLQVFTEGGRELFGIGLSTGEIIYEPAFDEINTSDLIDPDIKYVIIKYHGNYGLLNRQYKLLLDAKFEKMEILNDSIALVKFPYGYNDGAWSFLNLKQKKDLGYRFTEVQLWHDVYTGILKAEIGVKDKTGLWGFYNKTGKCIIPLKYSQVMQFSDGKAIVFKREYIKGKTFPEGNGYVINKNGNIQGIIPSSLASDIGEIGHFSDGLILYKSKREGLYGYLNSIGQIAIAPVYESGSNFVNGSAYVVKYQQEFQINKKGDRIK